MDQENVLSCSYSIITRNSPWNFLDGRILNGKRHEMPNTMLCVLAYWLTLVKRSEVHCSFGSRRTIYVPVCIYLRMYIGILSNTNLIKSGVETKMSQMEPMWNQLRELVEKYDQSANSTFRLAHSWRGKEGFKECMYCIQEKSIIRGWGIKGKKGLTQF